MDYAKNIIAIETPVTDYVYDEAKADQKLRNAFLIFLNPGQPPRKGDNVTMSAEVLQEKLLSFARARHIKTKNSNFKKQAVEIREMILGKPRTIEAGGAVANSFDTVVKSHINNIPLADGKFVTAIGEGLSGEVFAASLPGKIVATPAQGIAMEAHIIPIDGDRIIVTCPSLSDPPSDYMSPQQLNAVEINTETGMVVLGGYMHPTGKYDAFLNVLLKKITAVSKFPQQRPTLVLTAAAHFIAESPAVKSALIKAAEICPVLVFANTGEFRRLMEMDRDWRLAHDQKWHSANGLPLAGDELEKTKQEDVAYKADKLAANQKAYNAAFERFCKDKPLPATFVVTNGKQGVHVISAAGVSKTYLPPKPPHGVINTVGGGDGMAGGIMLGHLLGLNERENIELGFVCAGEVIGQDAARLEAIMVSKPWKGDMLTLEGLPAYLDPANSVHAGILEKLQSLTSPSSYEIERKFLIVNDAWKKAVQEVVAIQQHYVPAFSDNTLRLHIDTDGETVNVIVGSHDRGELCRLRVPDEVLEKFGRDNLTFLSDKHGNVPVDKGVEARVRFSDGLPVLTIKALTGRPDKRHELEFSIPTPAALDMRRYCRDHVAKNRNRVLSHGANWDVDIYTGPNAGRRTAEIETRFVDSMFVRPAWLGRDITGDMRYANRTLGRQRPARTPG